MSEKYVAYVGTYTHGSSIGIHICDVNLEEGSLTERKVVPVNNSSYITKSQNGKYLYSIADEGVAVFAIAPDGDLKLINQIDIDGMRGCYLSVDKNGKHLYVGGYHDGKVTTVHTHKNGRLGSVEDGIFHTGLGSVAERNFRPHVSCVRPTPEGRFLCAVDSGIDQVKLYEVSDAGKLKLVDIIRCTRESGPKELIFDKSGKYAYLIYELANKLDVFEYRCGEKRPHFTKIQTVDTLMGKSDRYHDATEALTMSIDGKHLFCTIAGANATSMYEIDEATGKLTLELSLPTSGSYPKDIKVFPDDKHIAVVNHESNTVTTFCVDYEKDILLMQGKPVNVETPNCILFHKCEK